MFKVSDLISTTSNMLQSRGFLLFFTSLPLLIFTSVSMSILNCICFGFVHAIMNPSIDKDHHRATRLIFILKDDVFFSRCTNAECFELFSREQKNDTIMPLLMARGEERVECNYSMNSLFPHVKWDTFYAFNKLGKLGRMTGKGTRKSFMVSMASQNLILAYSGSLPLQIPRIMLESWAMTTNRATRTDADLISFMNWLKSTRDRSI